MKVELIDTLTRSFAMPAPRRFSWRVLATSATAGLWTHWGVQPKRVFTATAISPGCSILNNDGTCPSNTTKQTQPGNTPTMNGCGPEGGTITIPQGYGSADYTGPCNNHDVCYEECFTPKDTCDQNFRDEMYASCAAAYPGVLNTIKRLGCYERAFAYYQAVSQFGDNAWLAAQKKACECCPVKLYCNCNKRCYTDVNLCLNECQPTLGCFTGICDPAEPDQCPA
jgi:hypothetical protein